MCAPSLDLARFIKFSPHEIGPPLPLEERLAGIQSILSRDPDAVNRAIQFEKPLEKAVRFGDVEAARLLIDCGADVNSIDIRNETLLNMAVRNSASPEMVPLLLERGADPEFTSSNKITPLMQAAANTAGSLTDPTKIDHDAIANFHHLLDLSTDVNRRDKAGRTALHRALYSGFIEPLLARGAKINACTHYGTTPLHHYIWKSTHKSLIETLIQYGPNLNVRDRKGRTPLHYAVQSNHFSDTPEILIKAGADLDIQDRRGYTPVHWATTTLAWKALTLLIAAGANVNIRDKKGRTPLGMLEAGDFGYLEDSFYDYDSGDFPPGTNPDDPDRPEYSDIKYVLESAGGHP